MANILENRITLVHPHSRNKSDRYDWLFILVVFNYKIQDYDCNICQVFGCQLLLFQYSVFLAGN